MIKLFLRAGDGGRLLIGFVHERAEQTDAFHRNQPLIRNFDFAAAHEGHRFDGGGIAFHVRLAQINLKAAHDGQNTAAFEFFAGDAAFEAAENCNAVEIGVRGTGAAPAIENLWPRRIGGAIRTDARAGGLPDHQDADSDDDQWPDGIEVDVRDTEIFKNRAELQRPAECRPKGLAPRGRGSQSAWWCRRRS